MKHFTFSKINPRFAYAGQFALENLLPGLRGESIGSNLSSIDLSGVTTLTLPSLVSLTVTGALTTTGGVIPPGTAPTSFHTGGLAPATGTVGTDTTGVTTVTWISEVFIPVNTTLTGISVLNGVAVAGNVTVGLANSAGAVVASSTTGTAASGTQAYQQFAFSTTYSAVGPAKHYVLLQMNNTGYHFRTHVVGNFGASTAQTTVYGTLPTITPPTTFTTGLGPIADTY